MDEYLLEEEKLEMESNNLFDLKNFKDRRFTETFKTSTFRSHWSMEDEKF